MTNPVQINPPTTIGCVTTLVTFDFLDIVVDPIYPTIVLMGCDDEGDIDEDGIPNNLDPDQDGDGYTNVVEDSWGPDLDNGSNHLQMRNDNNTRIAMDAIFNGGLGRNYFRTDPR